VWKGIPLREAIELAGSFDALRPYLCDGSILARHNGLYVWPGGGVVRSQPRDIPPALWAKARLDPTAGRVIFATIISSLGWDGPLVARKVFAVEIEVERQRVEALRPKRKATRPRRKRGAKQSAVWDSLLMHLDAMIARGKIANPADEAFPEARDWLENNKRSLSDDALRKGIKRNRPKWFEA
jgi:hypothetical protein